MKGKAILKRWLATVVSGVMMFGIGTVMPETVKNVVTKKITAEAAELVDDYPSKYKNAALDAIADEWKFYNRECTSFVAWRLNSRNGINFTASYGGTWFGHAGTWGSAARGIGITVDMNPAPGSVFWQDDGGYGHVAWVNSVNGNGTVTIEEYNHNWDGAYHYQTVAVSLASGYIHFKDLADAWYKDYNKVDLGAEFYANIENIAFNRRLSYSGNNAIAAEPDNSNKQLWRFVRQSDGGYSILNKDSGLSLDIANYGTSNGTNVQMVAFSGNTAQHFYLYHTIGGYLFRPACSDLVFDLETFNSYNLATYPLDDYFTNKTFSIIKQYEDYPLANLGDDFDARIENPVLKLYLTADGNNVCGKTASEGNTQLWHFTQNADGSYSITSKVDDRSFDVDNYGTTNGTNIKLMGNGGNNAQRFFLYEVDEAYLFRPLVRI